MFPNVSAVSETFCFQNIVPDVEALFVAESGVLFRKRALPFQGGHDVKGVKALIRRRQVLLESPANFGL